MLKHRFGDRYLRLDTEQSPDQAQHLALDVATENAQKTIGALAAAAVQANTNTSALGGFFQYRAPEPTIRGKVTSLNTP